jgi:hypothetical protein
MKTTTGEIVSAYNGNPTVCPMIEFCDKTLYAEWSDNRVQRLRGNRRRITNGRLSADLHAIYEEYAQYDQLTVITKDNGKVELTCNTLRRCIVFDQDCNCFRIRNTSAVGDENYSTPSKMIRADLAYLHHDGTVPKLTKRVSDSGGVYTPTAQEMDTYMRMTHFKNARICCCPHVE